MITLSQRPLHTKRKTNTNQYFSGIRNSFPGNRVAAGPTPYMAWPLQSTHQYYSVAFSIWDCPIEQDCVGDRTWRSLEWWEKLNEPWVVVEELLVVREGGWTLSGERSCRSLEWWWRSLEWRQEVGKPWVVKEGGWALSGERRWWRRLEWWWRSLEWWEEVEETWVVVEEPWVVTGVGQNLSGERKWMRIVVRGFGRAYSHQH
jgi:hypothetical protein